MLSAAQLKGTKIWLSTTFNKGKDMKVRVFVLTLLVSTALTAEGKQPEKKVYTANPINPKPPVIDGILDDEIWNKGEWESGFVQSRPYDGAEPSQQTSFKILYDDHNIYIGLKMLDTEPDMIERRMTRRDGLDGDDIRIFFDSFFDKRTAFGFAVTSAGIKADAVVSGDGQYTDFSWDPVWYANISHNAGGWTAEIKIPFNQLRFAANEEQVWGLQVERMLYRKEEQSMWQHIPQDTPGEVSRYGELHGIRNIKPSRRIEILPYTVGKHSTLKKEEGNPFRTGSDNSLLGGIDAKVGLTGDLTLDMTVNPDFGQVEADPSEVNLTAYETFFEEKRPFFVEGKNIFNYNLTGGDGDFSRDNVFYSRRIGRRPHHTPDDEDDMYSDMPENTSIASAMKITGKTRSGVSVGILDAVTTKEFADIDRSGERSRTAVEPITNYFVGRLQKDYRNGDTRIGGIITSTNRVLEDSHLKDLPEGAYTGGADFVHNWDDKTYYLELKGIFSHVRGSDEAMLDLQHSALRYYQRPDADPVNADSSAASLSGHGGNISFGKQGSGHWRFNLSTTWRSPGLELNDVGYLRESDVVMQSFWCQYREWEPRWIFRNFGINFNQWNGWNFGREKIFEGGNINTHSQFKNFWSFGFGINRNGRSLSKNSMRGGPLLLNNPALNGWIWFNTDNRKTWQFNWNASFWRRDGGVADNTHFGPGITWRPRQALSLKGNLSFSKSNNDLQYIDTESVDNDDRFIFGRIRQKTAGIVMRLDYAVTPNLTIQYYGQPFISAGKYSNFKMITSPRAAEYHDRFREYLPGEIAYDEDDDEYTVSETLGGSYSFDNPNYNFLQFRSNLVIRWEYRPGSTLFLVWAQSRTGSYGIGDFDFGSDMNDLFRMYPQNVFLIKFNRWFSL